MSASRFRLVMVGAIAALLIAGLVIARTTGKDLAPKESKEPPAITSFSQLAALLPRTAGALQYKGTSDSSIDGPELPECIQPLGQTPPQSPLFTDIINPVAEAEYIDGSLDFNLYLFRLGTTKLAQARNAVVSAGQSCRNLAGDLGNDQYYVRQQPIRYGDAAAVYYAYILAHPDNLQIRGADTVQLVLVSRDWGISIISTSDNGGLSGKLQAATILGSQLPDLLRQLDQSLGTSFLPPGGRTFPLSFPAQPSYLLSGGAADQPYYRPSSMVLSGDSSLALTNVTWQSWTAQSADGTGNVMVNLCNPNCAAGDWQSYPARISASQPEYQCLYPSFSKVTFSYLTANHPDAPASFDDSADCTR
jgi:hypothetical protein